MQSARHFRNGGTLLAAIIAVGVALRVVGLINRPSMGLDEARLALSIASRSYAQLFPPLDHDQNAPLLFLWVERLMADAFGVSDTVLRIVPLIAGIGSLLLGYYVFRPLVGRAGAILGVAMLAFSPALVYYSIAVKQYGVEVFATLFLLKVGSDWLEHPQRGTSKWMLLAGGVGAMWMAAPAIFVVAAIICMLGWAALRYHDRNAWRSLLLVLPIWTLSFAAAYLLVYRHAATNSYMQRYWTPAFLTPEAGPLFPRLWNMAREAVWGILMGYPGALGNESADPVLYAVIVISICGVISGLWWIARGRGVLWAILVAGPLAVVVAASLLGKYPIALRLMLFATPIVQLLLIAGVRSWVQLLPPLGGRVAWMTFGLAMTLPLLAVSFVQVTSLNPPEHVRALVDDLRRMRQREPVYVFTGSIPSWTFYSTNWSSPDRDRLRFLARIAAPGGPAFENAPSRGRRIATEGHELVYETSAGHELYGIPTGMEWRPIYGIHQSTADTGWVENEVARIIEAADPSVWVVMSHVRGVETGLLKELEHRGGLPTFVREGNDSYLARYIFPKNAGTPAATFGRRNVIPSAGK